MDRRVLKSGISYVVGDLLVKCMTFITTPIFARMLTKSEYGNVANFTAWYTILAVVTTMSLEATFNRARFDFEKEFNSYISSLLILSNISTVIIYMFALMFRKNVINILGMDWKYVTFMFICMFFLPAWNFFFVQQRIMYNYKFSIGMSLLGAVGGLLLSLILVTIWEDKEAARIIGMQLPNLLISICIYIYYLIKGAGIKFSFWKYALKICLPYIPHLISLSLLTNMDRVMVKNICGSEDTAVYSMAYSCSFVVTILLTAINNAMSPWVGEKLHQYQYEDIRSISKVYVLTFTLPALIYMMLVPEVLYILGGKTYMEAKYILAPLVMSCICQFMYTMYVNIEQYEKKTIPMAIASIIAALINAVLNIVFISQFGYYAAAYTTLFSYIILLFIHMFVVKRIGLLKVYNTNFILGIFMVALISMFAIIYLYKVHIIIRYVVILIVLICSISYAWKKKSFIFLDKNKPYTVEN